MREAIALAHEARRADEVPVGAVLVADEHVVGRGCNAVIGRNDPTAHAECLALRDASVNLRNYRLPGTTLYVTIEPCLMCVGAIVHARVKQVVFGACEPKAGAVVSTIRGFELPQHNHRVDCVAGVLESECRSLIQNFFATVRASGKR